MIPKTTADFEEKYIGSTINDRYKIIKLVGTGGMGSVYLAEHEILRKKVALKILHYEQSKRKDTVERFKREAIAASNIGQDNIVDVTDFGYTEEGNAYFVMEYLPGCSEFRRHVIVEALTDLSRELRALFHNTVPLALAESFFQLTACDAVQQQSIEESGIEIVAGTNCAHRLCLVNTCPKKPPSPARIP